MWLRVVKHVIRDRSLAISESANILKERPLLSIEDVLPIFPDFVVIDTFKKEISGCLEEYNRSLTSLRTDIIESITASSRLQSETWMLNSREIAVPAISCCALSGRPIFKGCFHYVSSGFAYQSSPPTHVDPHYSSNVDNQNCTLTGHQMISSIDSPLHTMVDYIFGDYREDGYVEGYLPQA